MIRPACEADVPAMLEIYRPYVLHTAHTFEYDPPTQEAFLQRFLTVTQRLPWLVWEQDGAVLGYVYADLAFTRAAYQWTAELSVYLRQDKTGMGIGKRLYEAAEALLRRLGYFTVYAIVTQDNAVSCAFHEAMGYAATAVLPDCGWKLGRWHGVIWYEKRLRQGAPEQAPQRWDGKEC